MKKLFLSFTMMAAVLSMLAGELTVGSYNIRYDNQWDVKDGNAWSVRKAQVCGIINFESPDIIGLQEVLNNQLLDVLQLLPDYDYIGVGRDNGSTAGEYAAIFYRRDRLQLIDHGNFWLSETPEKPGLGWDAACVRICTWGQFKDKQTGQKFYHFNLHMDHVGVTARRESAKLVVQRISQIANDAIVLLTGDFNTDQKDEIYQIFTQSGFLKDSYETAQKRYAPNGTFNAYDLSHVNDSRIDHLFTSPKVTIQRYGMLPCVYWDEKGQTRLPSDHFPVFVHIAW